MHRLLSFCVLGIVTLLGCGSQALDDGEPAAGATTGSGGAKSSAANSGSGGSPVMVPPACLAGMSCAKDSDCMTGYGCNLWLTPTECEKLDCGPVGTQCSEDANCAAGLKCLVNVCVPASACLMGGQGCGVDTDCCGAKCYGNKCCESCTDQLNGVTAVDGPCPASKASLEGLNNCVCNGACAAHCATSVCLGPAATSDCLYCMQKECPSELSACMAN